MNSQGNLDACSDGVSCENCDLCRVQDGGVLESGITNDLGWWCLKCLNDGKVYTEAELDFMMLETDYLEFASELKALRQLANKKDGE